MQRRLNVQKIRQRLIEINRTIEDFKASLEGQVDRRTVERLMSGQTKSAHYKTVQAIAECLELLPKDLLLLGEPEPDRDQRVFLKAEVHWPITGPYLVGREQGIEQLDNAWTQNHIHIVSIIGWGGVGKSTLVNHWLGKLAQDNWRGAERVFGWTFYNQGVRDTVASADEFLDAALRYFGDPEPGTGAPLEKGHRLARLVQEKRTLLLLDGLEPLQYPPGSEDGRLKDAALATLLKSLALQNTGLCVITTRLAVAELAAFQSTTAKVVHLDALSEEAGAELLHTLGVKGSNTERRAASREFGGHALALNLLGTYLHDVCGGDVNRRREIALLSGLQKVLS